MIVKSIKKMTSPLMKKYSALVIKAFPSCSLGNTMVSLSLELFQEINMM